MPTRAAPTALVTGAGSGIGRAVSLELAAEGYRLAVTDVDPAAARETVDLIRRRGGSAMADVLDVTDPLAWDRVLAALPGSLRVLVNNAGICVGARLVEMSLADWQRQLGINLEGTFLGMQRAVPLMAAAGGGAIVNIASVAAIRGIPGLAGYCASKAGIVGLSRAAAIECAVESNGVRVNAVLPGAIETPIWSKIDHGGMAPADARARDEAMARHRAGAAAATPQGHAGTPGDVAGMVAFLVSDRARFVTGGEFLVDGGAAAGA